MNAYTMQFDTIVMLFGDNVSYNNMMHFPKDTDIEVSWEFDDERDQMWFSIGDFFDTINFRLNQYDHSDFLSRLDAYAEEHKDKHEEPEEEELLECEICDSGLPATKINGIYCCIRCDNFKCKQCGVENDKHGYSINWDEKLQMCVCDNCIEEEVQTRIITIDGKACDSKSDDICDCCVKGWDNENEWGRCDCIHNCGLLLRDCKYKCVEEPDGEEEEVQTRIITAHGKEYLMDKEYTIYDKSPPHCILAKWDAKNGKFYV